MIIRTDRVRGMQKVAMGPLFVQAVLSSESEDIDAAEVTIGRFANRAVNGGNAISVGGLPEQQRRVLRFRSPLELPTLHSCQCELQCYATGLATARVESRRPFGQRCMRRRSGAIRVNGMRPCEFRGSGVRLVYRRLRHARSERTQGVAGRVGVMRTFS